MQAINRRLGFTLTALFVERVLQIPRTVQIKSSFYWREDQLADIGAKLAQHVKARTT